MFTLHRCIGFSLLWCYLGASPTMAEVRDANEIEAIKARSWELIDLLGDPSFRVRQEATRELLGMGRIAREALNAGKSDPNAEVRQRCRQLLPIAERLDLMARIDSFLNDPTANHDLPGLSKFLSMVGDEKSGRQLYAEMIKTEPELLRLIEGSQSQVVDSYRNRVTQTQQLFNTGVRVVNGTRIEPEIPIGQLATLLFVGTSASIPTNDTVHRTLSSLFYRAPIQKAFKGDGQAIALRKILYKWLETRSSDYASYQGVYLILQADVKDALPLTLRLATEAGTYSRTRGLALMAVGKLGNKKHIPELEKLFDDQGVLTNVMINNVRGTVQVRDVALAMSIQLSGQKVTDYPFDLLKNRAITYTSFTYLGFSDDEQRAEAFKKWKDSKSEE